MGSNPTKIKMEESEAAAPPIILPALFNKLLLCSLMICNCLSVEKLVFALIHSLSVVRCSITLAFILGKSAIRLLICAEKNQMIKPSKMKTNKIAVPIASASGNFLLLQNR